MLLHAFVNNDILHLSSVQPFRYPEMRKVQGAKCAISKLMYGLSVCTDDNHSLKLVAYRLVHTDEPYINLHILLKIKRFKPPWNG